MIRKVFWALVFALSLAILVPGVVLAAEVPALGEELTFESLTLALLLTTAGSTIAAGFITGFVSLLSNLSFVHGNEARTAAFIAAVLVGLLGVQAVSTGEIALGVPLILAVAFGWYTITRMAMSIYDDWASKPASLTKQVGGDVPGDDEP